MDREQADNSEGLEREKETPEDRLWYLIDQIEKLPFNVQVGQPTDEMVRIDIWK